LRGMKAEGEGQAVVEAALCRKEGQMSMSKADDYEPPPSKLGGATTKLPRPCRRLYRSPGLPVTAGAEPAGSVVSVQHWRADTRDWRRLSVGDVQRTFAELEAAVQIPRNRVYPQNLRRSPEDVRHFEGLMAAVAVGTLQASSESCYWVESADGRPPVECRDVRAPMSRAILEAPDLAKLESRCEGLGTMTVCSDRSPLEICRELATERTFPRIGLVRFVPVGDVRSTDLCVGDFREGNLLLRTTYLEALQEMPRHLHAEPTRLLESGAVIYTSDVSILRGPVEEGAAWLASPAQIEVLSVALLRQPRCDDQAQYARTAEKAHTSEAIDRVLACAAMLGIDALVIQPPGVGGAAGCHHPAADAGDLLRKAILAHGRHLPRVWVCQEHATQLRPTGCWDAFVSALENGRAPTAYKGLVPLAASPYVRPGWPPFSKKIHRMPLGATFPGLRCAAPASGALPPGAAPPLSAASTPRRSALESAGRAVAC